MAETRVPGFTRRARTFLQQGSTLQNELRTDHATQKTAFDEVIAKVNELVSEFMRDQVLRSATAGAGVNLDVDDGDAADIETNNAVVILHQGREYAVAADAALDISAAGTCAGDTVTQNKSGVIWVFTDIEGNTDVETPLTPQAYDSAVEALAEGWINATNTLPPGDEEVAIGAAQVTEGNSGTWTIGDDSISGETETFYSFWGLPAVVTRLASLALDADAATFTYGAGVVRLGTGTRVALTGKANVVLNGSNVATGAFGAWLIYALADDVEYACQVGATYTTLALAQAAVRDHSPNPLLPVIGVLYVTNASGATFTTGTTKLDATGITCTFVRPGPGANHLEIGRAQLNQPHQVLQNAGPDTLTAGAVDNL